MIYTSPELFAEEIGKQYASYITSREAGFLFLTLLNEHINDDSTIPTSIPYSIPYIITNDFLDKKLLESYIDAELLVTACELNSPLVTELLSQIEMHITDILLRLITYYTSCDPRLVNFTLLTNGTMVTIAINEIVKTLFSKYECHEVIWPYDNSESVIKQKVTQFTVSINDLLYLKTC